MVPAVGNPTAAGPAVPVWLIVGVAVLVVLGLFYLDYRGWKRRRGGK